MRIPTLQDAIDQAGSPLRLLWELSSGSYNVPELAPEYAGWREEQAAWRQGVAFFDLSHALTTTHIHGPKAEEFLVSLTSIGSDPFPLGESRPFVASTEAGHLVCTGSLLRERKDSFWITGTPAAYNWVDYHAERFRPNLKLAGGSGCNGSSARPLVFRFRIRGARAPEFLANAFGNSFAKIPPGRALPISIAGCRMLAVRLAEHGPQSFEFTGSWTDADLVRDTLIRIGRPVGMVPVGSLAYATSEIESGRLLRPLPGIYSSDQLRDYRHFLSSLSYEASIPLGGSYLSENIESYYLSPFELGCGKWINLNREFIGRKALERAAERITRAKVTLVFNIDDVREFFGANPGYMLRFASYQIERESLVIGRTLQSAFIDPRGTILSVALIDQRHAVPGTEVKVAWGDHPRTDAASDTGSHSVWIRAVVAPSPYVDTTHTIQLPADIRG